jgi:hypothetical protein
VESGESFIGMAADLSGKLSAGGQQELACEAFVAGGKIAFGAFDQSVPLRFVHAEDVDKGHDLSAS